MVRARPEISALSLGVEAPARQGARSAHTGRMKATSNAARRDASAARAAQLFPDGPLAELAADVGLRMRVCGRVEDLPRLAELDQISGASALRGVCVQDRRDG